MATHLDSVRFDKCKSVFKERVLPNFPQTKRRFERYFKPSYEFIRTLPLNGYFKKRFCSKHEFGFPKPLWNRVTWHSKASQLFYLSFDLEVAFTMLGIKPLTLTGMNSPFCFYIKKYGNHFLSDLGLRAVEQSDKTFEVFDPVLVSLILSHELNQNIKPDDTEKVLCGLKGITSSDLLGYPEMLQEDRGEAFALRVFSEGEFHGVPYNCGDLSCAVYTPELVIPYLEAWASAAAMVEEIQDLGSTTSFASWSLPPPNPHQPLSEYNKEEILAQASIERQSPTNEWVVRRNIASSAPTKIRKLIEAPTST